MTNQIKTNQKRMPIITASEKRFDWKFQLKAALCYIGAKSHLKKHIM